MAIFNKIGKKINIIAKNAVNKSSEVMEISKLNLNINTEEDGLSDLYRQLGEYCFEKYNNGETTDKNVAEICEDIKIHLENISYFKEKINEIKKVIICANCGKENSKTNEVCSKCREPLVEKNEEINVEQTEPQNCVTSTEESEEDSND